MPKMADMTRKLIINPNLKQVVDLNTDFGQSRDMEAFADEENSLLRYVSSVNIPCCVHDGNPKDVLKAIETAKRFNCAVGAHIGYPDPLHQGDAAMKLDAEDLAAWIMVQMGAFQTLCKAKNATIEHVRPHGALYARFIDDEKTARVVAETLYKINPWLILVGPAGPVLSRVHEAVGIQVAPEVYLGKRYSTNGTLLLDRFQEGLPVQASLEQVKQLTEDGSLTSHNGQKVPVEFKTLHLSAKTENSLRIAEAVLQYLGQVAPLSVVSVQGSGWVLEAN